MAKPAPSVVFTASFDWPHAPGRLTAFKAGHRLAADHPAAKAAIAAGRAKAEAPEAPPAEPVT